MTRITDHKCNLLNDAIEITAGEPSTGGASNHYTLFVPDSVQLAPGVTIHQDINFQSQPLTSQADINGVTNEALIAVVIDRMRGFQHLRNEAGEFMFDTRGKFACRENAVALTHLEDALMWLQKRTRDRIARGVEGLYAK